MHKYKVAVPLTNFTWDEMVQDAGLAVEKGANVLEFRVDFLDKMPDLHQLSKMFPRIEKIITARHKEHAGSNPKAGWRFEEEKRIEFLQEAIDRDLNYVDIEYEFASQLDRNNSRTKIISSYHNFERTPRDEHLYKIYVDVVRSRDVKGIKKPDIIKIATLARCWNNNLRMFELIRRSKEDGNDIIGLCMGRIGQETRIYGPMHGSYMTYACLDESKASAQGQIPIDKLLKIWKGFYGIEPKS